MVPAMSAQPASTRGFRRSLSFRLGVGLCLGAGVILIAAGVFNLRFQRSHLTEVARIDGEKTADVIRSATREAMLRDQPAEARRIIETIAAQPEIEQIRVFDKQGRIRISTKPDEVGTLVDTDAEQCFACHERDEPLDRLDRTDRVRIFQKAGGERTLAVIAPIHNEPACSGAACHAHPASQRVLGVLDVQLSLASVDEALDVSERQLVAADAIVIVAVLIMSWLLTWRLVLRPVSRLTCAASRVAEGDLSIRIPVTSTDEIGEMSAAWNSMVEELRRARIQLEDWGHSLERRVEDKTAALEKAHQQMVLVEKMTSLGKLSAVVAHEINNPLTGIATYARLLRRKLAGGAEAPASSDAATARALKLIEEESRRCGNIVRNLLLFSRTPGARFSMENLQPVLERCHMLLRHQADLQSIDLKLDSPADLPPFTFDPSQIQQMIVVLAMNALEATPSGGTVEISALADEGGESMVLRVSDTGRGIPEEHMGRIFEPFFTTKEQGSGVGLGLSVVYGIVTRHHGKIDVQSRLGSGTVFTVTLPRSQPMGTPGRELELEEVTS